jgi:hypothetical protein
MPKLRQETYGSGDMSWLDSSHGLRNARTEILDISAFTKATHYPNGFIPSGTPVALVGGLLVPYDVTVGTTTGAGVLEGHILTDQPVVDDKDFGVPLFDHGRVKVAKIAAFYSNFVKPIAAKLASHIKYV